MSSVKKKNFSSSFILLFLAFSLVVGCGKGQLREGTPGDLMEKSELSGKINSFNWEERVAAAEAARMHAIDGDRSLARQVLFTGVEDSHSEVVIASLKGLAALGSEPARKKILETLESSNNSIVTWNALKALTDFKDAKNIPVFKQYLDHSQWLVREASIRGILKVGDLTGQYRVIPSIIQALKDDSKSVQITALENLSIKDEKLYEVLKKKLLEAEERDYSYLKVLLEALRGYELDEEVRNRLIDLLLHSNPGIRIRAFRVLKGEQEIKKQR
jgi:HEAT repeat protein